MIENFQQAVSAVSRKMASRQAIKTAVRQVRPILSADRGEARKRVLNLYKTWFRQMPYVGQYPILLN